MDFKNFRFGLIIRVVLLSMAIFLTIFAVYQNEWYVTTSFAASIAIISVISIIRYAEKFKRGMADFLVSLKAKDYISSSARTTNNRDLMQEAYQVILDELKNVRIDKEVQYHYLTTIVEHIKIALFSFSQEGAIEFINKTAKELLNQKSLRNINTLKINNPSFYNVIINLKSGESTLVKLKSHDRLFQLSANVTELKIQDKWIKIVTLQDIKQELDQQELESWQKLIRVLTHEIMNSVTPISSLSNAINETLEKIENQSKNPVEIPSHDFEDIHSGLQSIESRSKGLLKFVSSYKQLTRIPKPEFKKIDLNELVNHCVTLLKQQIIEKNIKLKFIPCETKKTTLADYDQIEQVVINLLLNAIEASFSNINPEIIVMILAESQKQKIVVKDNGSGISIEDMDKIFIPFFTTKKEGSGIGLSISRQIMQQHNGTIQVNSEKGKGAEFVIEF